LTRLICLIARQPLDSTEWPETNEGHSMSRVQVTSPTQCRPYSLLTFIRKFLPSLSAVYALSITLFLVTRALIGERLPVIALLNIFVQWAISI
jgi:hypothetical protein